MPDLEFQNLSTVQNSLQPGPATIASATTIAPTGFLSIISGTAAIVNVTPPVSGTHMLIFIPSGAFTFTTAGNISLVMTAVVNSMVVMVFNPLTGKYLPGEIPVAT
jgi:hypothetical protein